MPRISVIMSVYKEPIEWMREAIDSILNQTYRDFEFIIINDCPTRKENEELFKEFQQNDSRVSIINNEKNIGLTKSLNKGLSVAKGEFIARMDADDISLPKRFETQIAYLENHPEVCGVGSWTISIDGNGKQIGSIVKYETDPRWTRALFLQNSQVAHPAAMFRKKVKNYDVWYNESVRYAQDYSLWISLLPYGEVTNVPEVLFCYRINEQQITSTKKEEQQKCAGVAQRNAFGLFNLPTSDAFLDLFFSMTIQRNLNFPKNVACPLFCDFFKTVDINRNNALALEVIYSTYIAYLRKQNKDSRLQFLYDMFTNSSSSMLFIGFKLYYHLFKRKLNRK